tara:strand:- start:1056 stop:2162 length:1107 start_codon:yes stop_codon:yes gene_type:complete
VHKLDLLEDQFDRQKKIVWWEQERLLNSKVLLVGAGALGNEIAKNLTLVGVGQITIVDNDLVDLTNISRCVFFNEDDIGKNKAELLSKKIKSLRNINSDYFIGKIQELGIGVFENFDIVIGALDNREARSWVNEYSRMFGKPWVDGAIEGLNGLVRSFGIDGVCYECTLSEEDLKLLSIRKSCALLSEEEITIGKVPTTATSASIISGFQTQEALIYLSRKKVDLMPLISQQMTFFGESMSFLKSKLKEKKDCYIDHECIKFEKINVDFNQKIEELINKYNISPSSRLYREIVSNCLCAQCDNKKVINKYISSLKQKDVLCADCNSEMQLETEKNIKEFINYSLNELNFPDNELIISEEKYILLTKEI